MSASVAELYAERRRIEAEIDLLQARQEELGGVLGEFEHEARRTRDALERLGGCSRDLEKKAAHLRKNQQLTRSDLRQQTDTLHRLRQRLVALEAEIQSLDSQSPAAD